MTQARTPLEAYRDLAEYIVGSLIDEGVDFKIEAEDRGDELLLNAYVPPDHRGQVIGRGGRIARSIRTVLDASNIEIDKSIVFDIVD